MNWCKHIISVVGVAVLLGTTFAAEKQEKSPAPTDAAQKQALALIKDVYGKEHADAKTNEQKQALAKKLLGKAGESQDPTNTYALLRVARDIAVDGSDGQTAFQAIDELDRQFQIDVVRMKASVLHSLSKKARSSADRKAIAEHALELVDGAVVSNDFELAGKLIDMALPMAQKARAAELVKKVRARNKEIEGIAKVYAEVKEAAKKLESNPTDPDANLSVGRFRCVVTGDWEGGLPMLALGSDAALKALAIKELEGPKDADEQIALADGWWRLAEKEEGTTNERLQERAAYWYRKVLPGLTGLVKDKVSKRLADIEGVVVFLDDIKESSSKTLGGVGKHGRSSDGNRTGFDFYGRPLPQHSLYTHPPEGGKKSAWVEYNLPAAYESFECTVGVPHSGGGAVGSPLIFRVHGDGRLRWSSRPIQKFGDFADCRVSIRGVKILTLEVACQGSANGAWAMWIDPRISTK